MYYPLFAPVVAQCCYALRRIKMSHRFSLNAMALIPLWQRMWLERVRDMWVAPSGSPLMKMLGSFATTCSLSQPGFARWGKRSPRRQNYIARRMKNRYERTPTVMNARWQSSQLHGGTERLAKACRRGLRKPSKNSRRHRSRAPLHAIALSLILHF